jgi:uncharacterized protein
MRLLRDTVYGDILLTPLATAILDTPECQRLSRIMQLGFAHLVFRGATHTRFAHSIGTYWMSREILRHVRANHSRLNLPLPAVLKDADRGRGDALNFDQLTEVVSTAALVHDITHIPFGHTLEDELQDIYLKHDALENTRLWTLLWDHRSRLAQLFDQPASHVRGLDNPTLRWLVFLILAFREDLDATPWRSFPDLLAEARQRVAESDRLTPSRRDAYVTFLGEALRQFRHLAARGMFQPFMADIVSGTISADLLDYTARDLYFTGVRGDFDQRIMHYFFIGQDTVTQTCRLALDVLSPRGYARLDITSEILNLMRLRYSMAERVYYHKNKVSASAMLARGLLGHDMPGDTNPYDDPDSVLQPEMSDEEMVKRLIRAADHGGARATGTLSAAEARDLGRGILNRELYVPAAVLTATTAREIATPGHYVDYFRGRPGGRERLQKMQAELSSLTGVGPHSVLIYCPPMKMQAKAINMPVRFEKNTIVPLAHHPDFRDEADLLNRRYQNLWKAFAFVHPQVIRTPGMVGCVVEAFCRRLGIPQVWAERIVATDYILEEQGEGVPIADPPQA